jgi:UDP-N-acetyl-D-galactosamine dehydrogenase
MKKIIAVIGVGYVGLPLALKFSNYFKVLGYDRSANRVLELSKSIDANKEENIKNFTKKNIVFTNNFQLLKNCNIYIITLPTPLNKKNSPDLIAVINLCKNLGKILKKKDTVIFESTVYPGATEELFLPALEKTSSLKVNKDFYLGYTPERINPGDKINTLERITKIVSGSNKQSLNIVENLYKKIIKAGLYKVSSIKVAELSKVVENTQRFVNIALVNEISVLCNKLKIQTKEVIDAASTKWNFMKFYPGLVGGHCIAVDPLYLSYKSKFYRLNPDIINTSHKINSNVSNYIVKILGNLVKKKNPKVLILGAAFKENCTDIRNSGIFRVIRLLNKKQIKPIVYDPNVNAGLNNEINCRFKFVKKIYKSKYDVIIILVAHDIFKKMGIKKIKNLSSNKNCLIMDIKSIFPKNKVGFQL